MQTIFAIDDKLLFVKFYSKYNLRDICSYFFYDFSKK